MRGRLGGAERFTIPVQSSDGALGEVFVAVGHGLKMTQTMLTVYSILLFSVDLRENPMFAGGKQGSRLGDVGLAGVCLGVLGKGCVGPEVDVVVGMEYPGAALAFEGHHHQLH